MLIKYRVFSVVLLFSLLLPVVLSAQIGSIYNERDDTYRVLGLKRAKQAYETAKNEYERQKELFDRKLIDASALEQAYNNYTDAEVNYQQSLLAVLFEKQYITVEKAIKYHAPDGSRHVRLTVANTSGGSAEFRKLINIDDELFRSLQPDIINNIYISILNDADAIISQPYEAKIDELRFGKPQELDFVLLDDLDAVNVYMIYSNGSQRSMKIYLQKDESVNKVAVQSEQFSQEIELGDGASFDLTLELYSGTSNTFSLLAVNLPREINRYFNSPGSSVRLRQVKFTESAHTKAAALQVTLPDRPTADVVMDKPIPFFVVVMDKNKLAELPDFESKTWTAEELDKLDVGYVRLELLPRGIGELVIRAPQLYYSIGKNEQVSMFMELENEGSHTLDNIEFEVDLPLNWSKKIEPALISSLGISRESRVNFKFTPPPDVSVGKYDIRIRTSGMSGTQPVNAEDKTVTVEIKAGANVVGTVLIVLLIVGLVGGIVVFGIKLSKK